MTSPLPTYTLWGPIAHQLHIGEESFYTVTTWLWLWHTSWGVLLHRDHMPMAYLMMSPSTPWPHGYGIPREACLILCKRTRSGSGEKFLTQLKNKNLGLRLIGICKKIIANHRAMVINHKPVCVNRTGVLSICWGVVDHGTVPFL